MYGGGAETGAKGFQAVVGTERGLCGEDVGGSLLGGTDRGRGEDGRHGDRYRLSWWEDNVANSTLGTDTNSPLAYAPILGHHHPIMSTLGEPGGQLERNRDTSLNKVSII